MEKNDQPKIYDTFLKLCIVENQKKAIFFIQTEINYLIQR